MATNEDQQKPLGQKLIEAGLIDEIQLAVALGQQKENGMRLGVQLLQMGFIGEKELSSFLKDQTDISISLIDRKISKETIAMLPKLLAYKYRVMPVACDGKTLVVATSDTSNLSMMDDLAFRTGKKIHLVRALEWDIENALKKYYDSFSGEELAELSGTTSIAEQYKKNVWALDNEVLLKKSNTDVAPEPQQRPRPVPVAKPAAPVSAASAPATPENSSARERHFSLQQAMLELLLERGIFTEADLLKKLMELERET